MAAGYFKDKIEDEKTSQYKKDKYQIKLDRLQIAIDEYNSKLITYDAYHVGSVTYNLGASYLGNKYTIPVLFYGEKALYPVLSIGGYFRYFMESNRNFTLAEDIVSLDTTLSGEVPQGWAGHDDGNRFKYASFGVRASYHLYKILKYNTKKWDLYGSAILGYTMSSKPKEFFSLLNNIDDFEPSKRGFNGGLVIGVRYFMDNNMGFFLEIGYERISLVSAGFSYRFFNEKESKKKKKDSK